MKTVENAGDALAILFGAKTAQQLTQGFTDVGAIFEAQHKSTRLAVRALAHAMTERPLKSRDAMTSWQAVITYLRTRLVHLPREQLRVLYLDRKNRLIADETANGTVDHCPVYPREIARRALELNACAIILSHNHPSGDPTPSTGDIEITRQVVQALKTLDIVVHDHIVVGAESTTSFRQLGLM